MYTWLMKLTDRITAQIDSLQANPVEIDANAIMSLLFDCNAQLAPELQRPQSENATTAELNDTKKTLEESTARIAILEENLSLFAELLADQKEKLKGKVITLVGAKLAPEVIKDIDAAVLLKDFLKLKREIEAGFRNKFQAQDQTAPSNIVSIKPFTF